MTDVSADIEVHPDVKLAQRYHGKAHNAKSGGHDFTLTFTEYKKLVTRKTCYYTGIKMVDCKGSKTMTYATRTLDRIDSTKGYITGNVVACCHAVNAIKAIWEDPKNPLTPELIKVILEKSS